MKYSAEECVKAFCGLMNKKAAELGMNNSEFNDPAGVNNYSTANDILRCLIKAGTNKVINDIWSHPRYVIKTLGEIKREFTVESKTFVGVGTEALTRHYKVIGGKGGTLTVPKIYNSSVIVYSPDGQSRLAGVVMLADEPNDMPNNKFEAMRQAFDVALNGGEGSVCAKSVAVCKLPLNADEEVEMLYTKNPDIVVRPASMSKLMTAIVTLELADDLGERVLVTEEMINLVPRGFYQRYVKAGDELTVFDLLRTLMLPSSNAAGYILGVYFGQMVLEKTALIIDMP